MKTPDRHTWSSASPGDKLYIYHVRAVAGRFVRWLGSRGLAGQGGCGAARVDPLLFLPTVAEPDPNDFLLHVKLLCNQ